jgi:GTP-binding protein Era
MLAIAHRVAEADKFIRAGKYHGWAPMLLLGSDLASKTVGILGLGRIGSRVAHHVGHGFDCKVIYYDVKRNEDFEKEFNAEFRANAEDVLKEADFVCLLIDAGKTQDNKLGDNNEQILKDLEFHKIKPIIVINKVDSIRKEKVLWMIAELANRGFENIFLISATTGDGVEALKKHLISITPEAPWQFNDDEITDAPMKFVASEITREKLFLKLSQDLPYSLYVKTDSWEDLDNGQVKIKQTIFVLKESQKMIVLGKGGSMIKQIGEEARKDIGEILGTKVHLFLFVKVEENWLNKKESYEAF